MALHLLITPPTADETVSAPTNEQGATPQPGQSGLDLIAGGALTDEHEEIAPLDQPVASRIAGHAGVDATAPVAQNHTELPETPAIEPDDLTRQDYAAALQNEEATGPQDFGEKYAAAALNASGQPPTPADLARATHTANGLAAALPTQEDFIDHSIAVALDASVLPTSTNVKKIHDRMVQAWAETGQTPSQLYQASQAEPAVRAALLRPPPLPAPPETPPHPDSTYESADEFRRHVAERLAQPNPDAIEPVSYFGEPVAAKDWKDFAEQTGLSIVENSAFGYAGVAAGKLLKTAAGKVVGYIFDKAKQLDPGAPVGEAVKLVSPTAAAEHVETLNEQLAQGYTASGSIYRFVHDLLPSLLKDESGKLRVFMTPAEKAETDAWRADRDFVQQSLIKYPGLGNQTIAELTRVLEPFYKMLNPHMAEWERELDRGPAGAPMSAMIGDLIDYMQGRSVGVTLRPDSPFAPVADAIRAVNQLIEQEMRAAEARGLLTVSGYLDDYFRQMWKNPVAAAKVFQAGRMGSPAGFRERVFPTWADGLRAGLDPAIRNPLDLTLHDIAGKLRYIQMARVLEDGLANGLISRRAHAALEQLEGGIARGLWATPGYARSWNNTVRNGMLSNPTSATIYDRLLRLKNLVTSFKLLNPIFHTRVVGLANMAAGIGQGMEEFGRGQMLRAIGTLAGVPLRPITDYVVGRKAYRAYVGDIQRNPIVQQLVQAGLQFGHRPRDWAMSGRMDYFTAAARGAIGRELKRSASDILGDARNEALGYRLARMPDRTVGFAVGEAGRVMQTITHPVFDHLIPHAKAGSAMRRLQSFVDAYPNATEAAVADRAREIVRDVENRMGELNLDSIFWPRMAKQVLGFSLVSTSWKYSSYRGFLGAVGADIEKGQWKWNPVVTASTIGTAITYGAYNAVETFLHTGALPGQGDTPIHDLLNFRTGTANPDGTPHRGMIPTEFKELYDLGRIVAFGYGSPTEVPRATADYAMGAVNPFWQVMRGMWSGQDATGHNIAQMPGGWPRFFKEQLEPISESQTAGLKKNTGIEWLERVLGDQDAPEWSQAWKSYQDKMAGWRAKLTKEEAKRYNREQGQLEHPAPAAASGGFNARPGAFPSSTRSNARRPGGF